MDEDFDMQAVDENGEDSEATQMENGFEYSKEDSVFKQGAEARLTECVYLGRNAILKERFPKSYRHGTLDTRLNKARTKSELRGIVKAKDLGIRTPTIYFVDGERNIIIMERIPGLTAKAYIEEQREKLDSAKFLTIIRDMGRVLGQLIGKMHNGGIIHGDLTTSNMILRDGQPDLIVLIDFGLSSQGKVTAEEKGVELYVLERAIASTHVNCEEMMLGVLDGYREAGEKQARAVNEKLEEIRLRGRKRDMTG